MLFKIIYDFCDKLEDKVRKKLSHYPLIYAFIAGAGIIIFWRGIWHSMDFLTELFYLNANNFSAFDTSRLLWWDGPLSIIIGAVVLLLTGTFVSSFIGNEIIITGLKGEKKMAEKTKQEIEEDMAVDTQTIKNIRDISQKLDSIENKLNR